MGRRIRTAAVLALTFTTIPSWPWSGGGHMLVAYVAYKNLDPGPRQEVDRLISQNPMYSQWTKGVMPDQKGLVAFLRAATWPDCIKSKTCASGYTSDGGDVPPGRPTDDQNIGYRDMLMHKYWHFYDQPYSDGAPGAAPRSPNAVSEIKLLSDAIRSQEPDDVKSYDLVWLIHLVGDIHQPLHATSRFTANHPKGDAGGNDVAFCAKPCTSELHGYWDELLGGSPTISQVTALGNRLLRMQKSDLASISAPEQWAAESLALAKSSVYVPPISEDNSPTVKISPKPDPAYAARAKAVAQTQVLLSGYRLANLLNGAL